MDNIIEIKRALDELKDFQKATVDKIYDILTNEENKQNRFLVADEVGLGKTLVAKGIICRFAERFLTEKKKKIKIVYLCSSQSIANQNLNKLKVFESDDVLNTYESRLTMLPIKTAESKGYINYIPLTPATSFDVGKGGGQWIERIVILAMLEDFPELKGYRKALSRLLKQSVSVTNWNYRLEDKNGKLNELRGNLNKTIIKRFQVELKKDKELFEDLLASCKDERWGRQQKININKLIGRLRYLIVQVSVEELKPDIVIMDEFQRFRSLIEVNSEDNDIKVIAEKFFENKNQKIILLSATPYKLYSTAEELENGEDHFKEFKEVIEFLLNDNERYLEFDVLWDEYSKTIANISNISMDEAINAKNKVERYLKNIMCRTERIVVSASGNGLIDTSKMKPVKVTGEDIDNFLRCDNISKAIEPLGDRVYSPMEFYKSAPFMYSFMDHYTLKKNLIKHVVDSSEIQRVLRNNKAVFINEQDIANYRELNYGNSKFKKVIEETFDKNGHMLLWIPPSISYYKLRGPYEKSKNFSKSLIFSSWEMVPRMMATLLSYESERKTIGKLALEGNNEEGELEPKKSYFSIKNKRFPTRRLNFKSTLNKNDRPQTMSNMILLYPSEYLCNVVDLKLCFSKGLCYEEIRELVKTNIEDDMRKLRLESIITKDAKLEDKGWYWIAPLILDYRKYYHNTDKWLNSYLKDITVGNEENQTAALEHINYLKKVFNNHKSIGLGMMPEGLSEILTDMALGSPAILVKRTLMGIFKDDEVEDLLWNKAYEIGNEFRLKFAEAESIGIIDNAYTNKDEYWKKVLKYCRDGNLQSVLDEYAYLLYEDNRIGAKKNSNEGLELLANLLRDTMSLRNSSFKVDTINTILQEDIKKISMRTHYSISFSHKSNDDKSQGRIDDVRVAFNSPFRPFVLTTTSIGQEGLDFHWYCRKIIHWNIPSNPVDLEQREGRINRYKGLVIRQNLVKVYQGNLKENEGIIEMWNSVFEESKDKKEAQNDLIPYWMLQDDNKENTIKLERIIPYYPYSKDSEHLERLLKILSVYRVSLGQPRQEEMINYLLTDLSKDNLNEINKLVINLSQLGE